jgi:hypothetical protein
MKPIKRPSPSQCNHRALGQRNRILLGRDHRFLRDWVIFQSVESPNLHPPPGQPETERPNSDPPPAVLFTSFQLPTSKMLLKHIQFCMKVAPKHVQELLRRAVWELSRSISQPKHGWIGSLQGASLEMCDSAKDFENFLSGYPMVSERAFRWSVRTGPIRRLPTGFRSDTGAK